VAGRSRTEVGDTAVVISCVEHDQVEKRTDLKRPPDAKVVVLIWSAMVASAGIINKPCRLGCEEGQLGIDTQYKTPHITYRIGIHSKYACVCVSTFLPMASY